MDTWTPTELPYFAVLPQFLPSYEDITALASRDSSLNLTDPKQKGRRGRRIVNVWGKFVVKYGREVDLSEGENMLLVRKYTRIPIPKLYAMYEHVPSRDRVLVMEYIEGETLLSCLDELGAERQASVGSQLRAYLQELRTIPSPAPCYYGRPGGRPYLALPWFFKGKRAGPFDSSTDFLETYYREQFADIGKSPKMAALKPELLAHAEEHGASVFTHADLQAQNILQRPDGTLCLIDWESACFAPEFFEFFIYGTYKMATWGLKSNDDDPIRKYGPMVEAVIQAWAAFASLAEKNNDGRIRAGSSRHGSSRIRPSQHRCLSSRGSPVEISFSRIISWLKRALA